eukprot:Skav231117  [mRNA]  locus=scaffold7:44384:45473:+ [translate_table: standard]
MISALTQFGSDIAETSKAATSPREIDPTFSVSNVRCGLSNGAWFSTTGNFPPGCSLRPFTRNMVKATPLRSTASAEVFGGV